jgi:hypothetical protein
VVNFSVHLNGDEVILFFIGRAFFLSIKSIGNINALI